MSIFAIETVQLYNSTDGSTRKDNCLSSQTTNDTIQTRGSYWPKHFERIADRTVHPLRQTRMQMRRHCRPWSKILFVGQLSGPQARTRVCAAKIREPSQGVSRQLSEDQTHIRGYLQYQSRIVTTKGETVKNEHGHRSGDLHFRRRRGFRYHRGKYASVIGRRSVPGDRPLGGNR
jgi:hypothetical protein